MSTEPPHRLGSPPGVHACRSKWWKSPSRVENAVEARAFTSSSNAAPPTVPRVEPSNRTSIEAPTLPGTEPAARTTDARTKGWCDSRRRKASFVWRRSILGNSLGAPIVVGGLVRLGRVDVRNHSRVFHRDAPDLRPELRQQRTERRIRTKVQQVRAKG